MFPPSSQTSTTSPSQAIWDRTGILADMNGTEGFIQEYLGPVYTSSPRPPIYSKQRLSINGAISHYKALRRDSHGGPRLDQNYHIYFVTLGGFVSWPTYAIWGRFWPASLDQPPSPQAAPPPPAPVSAYQNTAYIDRSGRRLRASSHSALAAYQALPVTIALHRYHGNESPGQASTYIIVLMSPATGSERRHAVGIGQWHREQKFPMLRNDYSLAQTLRRILDSVHL